MPKAQTVFDKNIKEKEKVKIQKAMTGLRKFIKKVSLLGGEPPGTKISVYAGITRETGLRIHEITFYEKNDYGTHGASYIRGDSEKGDAIIMAAENFVLCWDVKPWIPEGWEEPWDDLGDWKWRLAARLLGKDPPESLKCYTPTEEVVNARSK